MYNATWGTVCDDGWGDTEATIVCQQLGFTSGKAYPGSHYGPGKGIIWLDDLMCSGIETSLEECIHNGWGQEDCNHNEDVGVKCLGKLCFKYNLIYLCPFDTTVMF